MCTSRALAVLLTICLYSLPSGFASPCPGDESLPFEKFLNTEKTYHIRWNFNNDSIIFQITVNTTGWIGLGISPNGNMQGSDILTAWVTEYGVMFQDRFADQKALPRMDTSNDWTLLGGWEKDGQTSVTVQRKLNTCDKDDLEISTDTARILWSYGPADPPPGGNPGYHQQRRGARSVALLTSSVSKRNFPDDTFELNVIMSKFQVPSAKTTYVCALFKSAARITKKHHVIAIDPNLQAGNEPYVHHMLLYTCQDKDVLARIYKKSKVHTNCYIPELRSCSVTIGGWAVGNEGVVYPEEAGLSIGAPDDDEYYMMQVHYDNPEEHKGIVDSSGFHVFVTPTLRKHDVGYIVVGDVAGLIIPPHQPDFQSSGVCPKECTQKYLPGEGVTIFAVTLHSHLLGRRMYLYQKRGESLVRVVDKDDHYDFDFQKTNMMNPPVRLLPSDELQVSCFTDSTQRTSITYGERPTTSEMCLAYVMYYPRTGLAKCESRSSWSYKEGGQTHTAFNMAKFTKSSLNAINWKNASVASEFQELALRTDMKMVCNSGFDKDIKFMRSYSPTRQRQPPKKVTNCKV